MRTAVTLVALAASTIALAGCGGDDSTAAGVTTTATLETAPRATKTTETMPTETATDTTPATPETKVITIRVSGGVPQGGIQRPTIDKGEKVVLVIRADLGEAVHLHGYNLEKDVVPGKAVRLPFTADIAGRFELELHPTDSVLAVLEVKP